MRSERIWRQMALASYGTRYLRGLNTFEAWYRHGIFWAARQQFRDPATRALIHDDFTTWLHLAKEHGARRVSLHRMPDLALPENLVGWWDAHALVLHYPDRHEVWACGNEIDTIEAWRDALPQDERWDHHVPDGGYYACEIDCYWKVASAPGEFAVPATDWRELARRVRNELEPHAPDDIRWQRDYAAFFATAPGEVADFAQLPVVPDSPAQPEPHALLHVLSALAGQHASDIHPKNDAGPYAWADAAERERIDAYGACLADWLEEVQLRAANETGVPRPGSAFVRMVPEAAPPPRALDANVIGSAEPAATLHEDGAGPAPAPSADSRGIGSKLAALLAFAVLCVFILAAAKLIDHFPWAVVLIALPLFLWRRR